MPYRIKVSGPDSDGDHLIRLQHRYKWSPFWTTIDDAWATTKSGVDNIKTHFKYLAEKRENPEVKPHVENFDV